MRIVSARFPIVQCQDRTETREREREGTTGAVRERDWPVGGQETETDGDPGTWQTPSNILKTQNWRAIWSEDDINACRDERSESVRM